MSALNNTLGPECDVAISSRVRLARNIADIPFPARLSEEGKRKVISTINGSVGKDKLNQEGYKFIDFDKLSPIEMRSFMENRIVSQDFINSSPGRELIVNEKNNLYVMVNEEDHLRIQSITPGLSLDEAFDNTMHFDDEIDGSVMYAYNESLGYLSHCPTNLGTGMRVSVMLHLPAMGMSGVIRQVISDISKVGLAIRGLYGEGTEAAGDLYQISNQITLGISEKQTLEKIKIIISKIIDIERDTRNDLYKKAHDNITDKCLRAFGTLTNAHMISIKEFFKLYSHMRLGVTCGIIKDTDYKTIDALLVEVMPANLLMKTKSISGTENIHNDVLRAKYIKERLKDSRSY